MRRILNRQLLSGVLIGAALAMLVLALALAVPGEVFAGDPEPGICVCDTTQCDKNKPGNCGASDPCPFDGICVCNCATSGSDCECTFF